MTENTLVIRADASTEIGTGHVMRCLALAHAWQELKGDAVVVVAQDIGTMADRLRSDGIEILRWHTTPGSSDDAGQTIALAQARGARWIAIDGYHFDTNYQQTVKQYKIGLLYVDDVGYSSEYAADIILNQNISADEGLYERRPAESRLLLGPRYALLRREFWQWRGWRRGTKSLPSKVLVTLGGSDPNNVTLKVIQALQQLDTTDIHARILLGAANPHVNSLHEATRYLEGHVQLIVDTKQMPEHMAWADVVVTAGGSTCWELALMGLPMLVIVLADNQHGIAEGLERRQVAINLGWHDNLDESFVAASIKSLLLDKARRSEMSRRSQQLVDGFGASRVASILADNTWN